MKHETENHPARAPNQHNLPIEAPSPWLAANARCLRPGGRVLDLACGAGRHARWLVAAGFSVLAVDRDRDALSALIHPRIETVCLDLEAGEWPLGEQRFDGIVVTRYLHRPLLSAIAAALAKGGVLIYETFMVGNEAFGRPSRAEFLLQPGELEAFAGQHGLEILASREGFEAQPKPAMLQAICARRP